MSTLAARSGDDRVLGKHRGLVIDPVDPLNLGRIIASVPAVLGEVPTGWAAPCAPYAGPTAGFFAIPPVGAGVWIEFEGGDVSRPIWAGCYWGMGEVPPTPPAIPTLPTTKIWRSEFGLTVAMDDVAQTITVTDATGLNGVTIDAKTQTATVSGVARVVLDGALIREGSQFAAHPAVLGDQLMTYLTSLVTLFNTHVHPGELAAGFLPVTPAPPVAQMLPPTPALLSAKVALE